MILIVGYNILHNKLLMHVFICIVVVVVIVLIVGVYRPLPIASCHTNEYILKFGYPQRRYIHTIENGQ